MEWATTADANYCHPTIRWAGYSYNNQVPIKRGAPLHCAQIVTERSQFQSIYVTFSHICAGSGAYVGRVPQGERPPSFLRYSSPGFVSGKGKRHLRPAPAYCTWDRYSHHRVSSSSSGRAIFSMTYDTSEICKFRFKSGFQCGSS